MPVALLALAAQPLTAAVSRWSGGSANWSSTRIPGWDGSAPNAVGATVLAQGNNGAVTTTNDVSGLKVGSISLTGGSTAGVWTISTPSAITLNQDNASSGTALLSNSSSSTASQLLFSGTGSLALADDLAITNSSSSTVTNGAIRIAVPITGTGNVTITNSKSSLTNMTGTVVLAGANTFTGDVWVKSGTTTASSATAFGQSTNVVTVGAASGGDASVFFSGSSLPANSFVITAGTGGTTTFATTTGGAKVTGNIQLDGNLTARGSTGNFTLSGVISGTGGLSSAGAATVVLSGANTYTGGTSITNGSLTVTGAGKLGSGTTTIASGKTLTFAALTGSAYAFGSGDTLTGSGTVALTNSVVTFSGLLSPGTSGAGALTLTSSDSSGTLRFDATTKFAFTLGADGTNTNLQFSDGDPTLDLGGGVINFDDFSFTTDDGYAAGNSYILIGGATSDTGELGSSLTGRIDGSTFGTLSMNGHDLVLTISAIPEPATYAAICGGLAFAGVIVLKRRKRAA